MAKFYVDNIVRIRRKRGGAGLPQEIGVVVEVLRAEDCPDDVQQSVATPSSELYRVLTVENCPPGCCALDDYQGEELEMISWGVSLDIYQFGG